MVDSIVIHHEFRKITLIYWLFYTALKYQTKSQTHIPLTDTSHWLFILGPFATVGFKTMDVQRDTSCIFKNVIFYKILLWKSLANPVSLLKYFEKMCCSIWMLMIDMIWYWRFLHCISFFYMLLLMQKLKLEKKNVFV